MRERAATGARLGEQQQIGQAKAGELATDVLIKIPANVVIRTGNDLKNAVIDAAGQTAGAPPIPAIVRELVKERTNIPRLELKSEMMNRDASGKVNSDPNAITAGKTIEVAVQIAAPTVIGAATKPASAPQTLKSAGALPETAQVAATSKATATAETAAVTKVKRTTAVEAASAESKPVQVVKNKFPNDPLPSKGRIDGIARIENGRVKIDKPIPTDNQVDFVVDMKGNLILGSKHHFLGNAGEVQAAGRMKIVNGKIKVINNLSGHYQPSIEEGRKFPEILRKMGLDLKNTKLELSDFEKTTSGYLTGNRKIVVNEYLQY